MQTSDPRKVSEGWWLLCMKEELCLGVQEHQESQLSPGTLPQPPIPNSLLGGLAVGAPYPQLLPD